MSHPAVRLAVVVGKPDAIRTEIVKGFVVLNAGQVASDHLRTEIQQHVRARLSAHEYPRELDFVDHIPMTTSGKLIRRHFRQDS
jgi:acetyl-CoA synthetase